MQLADLERERDQIEQQKKQLDQRDDRLSLEKLATVRGVPVDSLEDGISLSYRADSEVESAMARRQHVFEQQLLAEHEVGREIVKLQDEKENLLDTIWLATSPAQLKTLWTKVAELLHQDTTTLEKEALAIPAVESE